MRLHNLHRSDDADQLRRAPPEALVTAVDGGELLDLVRDRPQILIRDAVLQMIEQNPSLQPEEEQQHVADRCGRVAATIGHPRQERGPRARWQCRVRRLFRDEFTPPIRVDPVYRQALIDQSRLDVTRRRPQILPEIEQPTGNQLARDLSKLTCGNPTKSSPCGS